MASIPATRANRRASARRTPLGCAAPPPTHRAQGQRSARMGLQMLMRGAASEVGEPAPHGAPPHVERRRAAPHLAERGRHYLISGFPVEQQAIRDGVEGHAVATVQLSERGLVAQGGDALHEQRVGQDGVGCERGSVRRHHHSLRVAGVCRRHR